MRNTENFSPKQGQVTQVVMIKKKKRSKKRNKNDPEGLRLAFHHQGPKFTNSFVKLLQTWLIETTVSVLQGRFINGKFNRKFQGNFNVM